MTVTIRSTSYLSKTKTGRVSWSIRGLEIANRLQTIVGVGFKRDAGAPTTFGDLVESDWSDVIGWETTTVRATPDNTFSADVRGTVDPSNIGSALAGDYQYLFVIQGVSSPISGSALEGVHPVGRLRA